MSDPTFPPFTQPKYQHDAEGNPWLFNAEKQWVRVEMPNMPPPLQPPFEYTAPAHSAHQSTQYNFPPPSSSFDVPQSSSSRLPAPSYTADLRLPPLRDEADPDLSDGPTIAKARGLKPAVKVAGVRQKGKRKRDDSDDSDTEERPSKRGPGRPAGSTNFGKRETNKVLDLAAQDLPAGPKAWASVSAQYNKWAARKGRQQRPGKSVETRFKNLLKHKKPTGDPHCPPEVKRAHQIDRQINARVDTRELSDSDAGAANDDDDDGLSDASVEILPGPSSSSVRTAVAHRAPSPPLRRARLNAPELVDKLSRAFDPAALKVRDDVRADRAFQNTHMVTLVGQLRDAQASNENLRMQITILQNQIHQLERARDLAELRREFTQPPPAPLGHTAAGPRFKNIPDVVRVNGQVKYYSEDEEKENRPPAPSGSRLPGDNDAQPSDPAQSGGAEFPSGPSTSRAEA